MVFGVAAKALHCEFISLRHHFDCREHDENPQHDDIRLQIIQIPWIASLFASPAFEIVIGET